MSARHVIVWSDTDCLAWVTWFDRVFKRLLNFLPKTCELANWSLPLSLSPSALVRSLEVRMPPISLTDSYTLSSVLDTKHSWSPDCLRSIWTPRTLHRESKAMSLCLDILQPKRENITSTQKSTCLDLLCRAWQRKSWKYADHISLSKDAPTFHMAREILRNAVTEAIGPKGKTPCLKILADPVLGYTAR